MPLSQLCAGMAGDPVPERSSAAAGSVVKVGGAGDLGLPVHAVEKPELAVRRQRGEGPQTDVPGAAGSR